MIKRSLDKIMSPWDTVNLYRVLIMAVALTNRQRGYRLHGLCFSVVGLWEMLPVRGGRVQANWVPREENIRQTS